jgi:hypothetical protein
MAEKVETSKFSSSMSADDLYEELLAQVTNGQFDRVDRNEANRAISMQLMFEIPDTNWTDVTHLEMVIHVEPRSPGSEVRFETFCETNNLMNNTPWAVLDYIREAKKWIEQVARNYP